MVFTAKVEGVSIQTDSYDEHILCLRHLMPCHVGAICLTICIIFVLSTNFVPCPTLLATKHTRASNLRPLGLGALRSGLEKGVRLARPPSLGKGSPPAEENP